MDQLKKEIRDLKDENVEPLINLSYDRLANGSRYPYRTKKIDPDQEVVLKKLFDKKRKTI